MPSKPLTLGPWCLQRLQKPQVCPEQFYKHPPWHMLHEWALLSTCVSLCACAYCMLPMHPRLIARMQTDFPCVLAAIAQAAGSGKAQAAASALATAQSAGSGSAAFAEAIAQVMHLVMVSPHGMLRCLLSSTRSRQPRTCRHPQRQAGQQPRRWPLLQHRLACPRLPLLRQLRRWVEWHLPESQVSLSALSSSTPSGSKSLGSGPWCAPAAGLLPGTGFRQRTGLQKFAVFLLQDSCHVHSHWPVSYLMLHCRPLPLPAQLLRLLVEPPPSRQPLHRPALRCSTYMAATAAWTASMKMWLSADMLFTCTDRRPNAFLLKWGTAGCT